jgi:hypothetical protein
MQPYNAKGFRQMQRELAIRKYPDKDAQRALSDIFYDPKKLTYNERLKIRKQQAATFCWNDNKTEPPTQTEIKAKRVMEFSNLLNPKSRRFKV